MKGMNGEEDGLDKDGIEYRLLKVKGEFVKICWREGVEYIKEEVREIEEKNGGDGVGVYGSGCITNEEGYLLGKFAGVGL
ncbi:molybdopterin-dependent oxidoreductase, partial [Priestia megaterium]|uniref:molybdopterin-dependent oxidoreductase n=1 Tax=Priestia megaterium TaxID=1404 RepID=UPI001649EA74